MQGSIVSNFRLFLFLLISSVIVVSCGGGGGDSLPEPKIIEPDTEITGTATLGHIRNADIIVYAYKEKKRGEILAQSEVQTSTLGEFNLILKTKSQPILICVSGGLYTEEAVIGTEITFEPNQTLCSTVNYISGVTQKITISYYTHLATGLAQNSINNNKPAKESIIEANKRISAWLGFDIIKTQPIQITDASSINETQLNVASYGFANAAVSSLVRWAGIESGQTPFQGITSVSFSQTSYNDIVYDGILDGQASTGLVSVGTVPLNEALYRHNLALNILAVVSSPENKTAFVYNDIFPYAKSFNDSLDAVFNDQAVIGITVSKIKIANVSPVARNTNPLITAGVTNIISATVTSESYVNSVELFLNQPPALTQTLVGTATNNYQSEINFDASSLSDGQYQLNLVARDILGNETNYLYDNVVVSNSITKIGLVTPGDLTPVRGTVNIVVPLTDSFGISTVTIKAGNVDLSPVINATGTQATAVFNTTVAALGGDGLKTITITAKSNETTRPAATKTLQYLVDNTKPNANFINIETNTQLPKTVLSGNAAVVTGSSTDVTSKIDKIFVTLAGQQTPASNTEANPNFSVSIDTTLPAYKPDGIKVLEINSFDKAKNLRRVTSNVIVDNNPPRILINTPKLNSWYQNITIDAVVSDNPGSGIASSIVTFDTNLPDTIVHTGAITASQVITINIPLDKTQTKVATATTTGYVNKDEKIHSLSITASDRAGHTTAPANIAAFGYDVTDPLYQLKLLPPGSPSFQTGVSLNGFIGDWHIISNAEMNAKPFCKLDIASISDPGYPQTGSGLDSIVATSHSAAGDTPGTNSVIFSLAPQSQSYNLPARLRFPVLLGGGAIPPSAAEKTAMINSPGTVRYPATPYVRKIKVTARDRTVQTGSTSVDFSTDTYCVYWQAQYYRTATYSGFAYLCILTRGGNAAAHNCRVPYPDPLLK